MYLMDGNFGAKSYDSGYNQSIGGATVIFSCVLK